MIVRKRLKKCDVSEGVQTILLAVFGCCCIPQLGNLPGRFFLWILLELLYRRTHSIFSTVIAHLSAGGMIFFVEYVQSLGVAGAEAYGMGQCFGMGLAFAAPGAVIFYFNEKKERKKRIRIAELLCLFLTAMFCFVLGMALWLG